MNVSDYTVNTDDTSGTLAQIERTGFAFFQGMKSKEQFLALGRQLGPIFKHPDSDEHGITRIASREGTQATAGYLGFTSQALELHTERSGVKDPPVLLLLYCLKASEEGGASTFLDGRELFRVLRSNHGELFDAVTKTRSVVFGAGTDLHVGSIFEQTSSGKTCVRFRFDELGFFSAPLVRAMPVIMETMQLMLQSFTLRPGEGYILQNGWWLHGRSSFVGEREMFRILTSAGDPRVSYGFDD